MRTGIVIAVLVVLALAGYGAVWQARVQANEREAADLTGGRPHEGRTTMVALGCVACHEIPGFSGTTPRVGPPLLGFAERTFVAGTAENTPANLIQFLRDPRSIAPASGMPKLPMSEQQARDLAAFLYTLR